MNWIVFKQLPNDTVKYIHSDFAQGDELEYECIPYIEFTTFLYSLCTIKDSEKMQRELDSFRTLFLDIDRGTWNIQEEQIQEVSFRELAEANRKQEPNTSLVDRLWNRKKEKFFL